MKLINVYKEFWTPRFETFQIENSRTRCNARYEVESIIYDDKYPPSHLPLRILGYIKTNLDVKRRVCWNQFGACFYEGERLEKYDLIHPDQKEIDSAEIVFICLLAFWITLLCTILWN